MFIVAFIILVGILFNVVLMACDIKSIKYHLEKLKEKVKKMY